jgi:hypothetical protein
MMVIRAIRQARAQEAIFLNEIRAGVPVRQSAGDNVAQNHYSSKTKRRPKNSNRKDSSAATMAAIRQLEAKEKKAAK